MKMVVSVAAQRCACLYRNGKTLKTGLKKHFDLLPVLLWFAVDILMSAIIQFMYTKIILMISCFVSGRQIMSIIIFILFTAIQRGVSFLLPMTVYICGLKIVFILKTNLGMTSLGVVHHRASTDMNTGKYIEIVTGGNYRNIQHIIVSSHFHLFTHSPFQHFDTSGGPVPR